MTPEEAYVALRSLPSFRKVSRSILRKFTLDITLIAFGIRTGYLVDCVPIPPRVEPNRFFSEALAELQQRFVAFNDVVILQFSNDGDAFFVNATLLLERFRRDDSTGVSAEADTLFVLLSDKNKAILVPRMLPSVQYLLEAILASLKQYAPSAYPTVLPIQFPSIDTSDMVPLCAILLDYPLAYVPGSTGGPYLANTDLDVFSANIIFDDEKCYEGITRHTFAQFSCPCSLTDGTSEVVAGRWAKFNERISRSELPCRFESATRTERLDRVAL